MNQQIILIRTVSRHWGKGLTFAQAASNAKLQLTEKFTLTVFERMHLTLPLELEDIRVSDVDGAAEYPRDCTCVTVQCDRILAALKTSPLDLLTAIREWLEQYQGDEDCGHIVSAFEKVATDMEENMSSVIDDPVIKED